MGVGAIPAGFAKGTIYARESGYGSRRKTVIQFLNFRPTLGDEPAVIGKFVPQVYTFPEGLITFEGGVIDCVFTKGGPTAGISATFAGNTGLGTAVGAGAILATTAQNLIPTTARGAAVAGVVNAKIVSTSTEAPKLFDGTATPVAVFFNNLIADTDHDIAGNPTAFIDIQGTITLHWTYHGDK